MAVADRNVPGIAEYIRYRSMEATSRAMLGRGVSVIRGKTLIINLPGSPRAVRESLPSRRISRPSSQPSATTRRRASGHPLRPGMPLPPAPEPVLLDPTQSRLCLPALRQRQSTICFKKHRVIARNNLLQSAQAGKAFFRRNILIDVSDQLLCIGKPFRKWHLAQPHDVKHREQRIFNELTCQPPSPVFQCRWHVSFHRPTLPVPFSATSFFLMNRKLSYCFFHPTI